MAEFLGLETQDVIPATLHGCAVRVGVGPYPPNAERTHRKAMYAELIPTSSKAQGRMRKMNRERILAFTPLTATGAHEIELDPNGKLAEETALLTLREASKLAKGLYD